MDWSYIAGFFDGEGSLNHKKNLYRVCITQTDFDVLKAIQEFSLVGYVVVITKRKSHWKDAWLYYIASQKDVYLFLKNIQDKLYVKKELVRTCLPKIEKNIENIQRKKALHVHRTIEAVRLRKKGFTYRAIGKQLQIDFGYARRLLLASEK